MNKSDIRINIAFSNESVLTPTNHLFVMVNPPTALSISASSEKLSVTYLNIFPDQVEGIVFAYLRNTATGSLSVQTATITPPASGKQTINLIFSGISTGNYSASFFVESPNSVLYHKLQT